jgi:hypothetical protein
LDPAAEIECGERNSTDVDEVKLLRFINEIGTKLSGAHNSVRVAGSGARRQI